MADVVSREALRPIADVRRESQLRRVLRLLAARTAQELIVTDLARDAELDRGTTGSYIALLEALYLVVQIPAFATSATTRVKRRPKVLLTDTGMAAHLTDAGPATFGPHGDARLAGALFETLVLTEIAKQATWSDHLVDLSHFRDSNGPEVDLVVEDRRTGAVAAVEVKLGAAPTARDARHLRLLREALGSRFTVEVPDPHRQSHAASRRAVVGGPRLSPVAPAPGNCAVRAAVFGRATSSVATGLQ